jgi:hypothetical protein
VRYVARYVFDTTHRMIQWQLVPHAENNLKSNVGYMQLAEILPGRTQVIYSVAGDLKGTWFVPAFLKRVLAKRAILRAMRDFRRYVEEQRPSSPLPEGPRSWDWPPGLNESPRKSATRHG